MKIRPEIVRCFDGSYNLIDSLTKEVFLLNESFSVVDQVYEYIVGLQLPDYIPHLEISETYEIAKGIINANN